MDTEKRNNSKKASKKPFILVIILLIIFSVLAYVVFNSDKNKTEEIVEKEIISENTNLVESETATLIKDKNLVCNIVIKKDKKRKLLFEGKEISVDGLKTNLTTFWKKYTDDEVPFINHILTIDKNVEMKFINTLKKRMNKLEVERISYATSKLDYVLGVYLPSNFIIPEEDLYKELSLVVIDKNTFVFDGKRVTNETLSQNIKEEFIENEAKSLRIFYKPKTTFEAYFMALETSRKAVNELRDEYSQKNYGEDYASLSSDKQNPIRGIYFWHVIDEMN